MGPLGAVFAQPVPGLLTDLFITKKLLLHSVMAEIATEILKFQSQQSFVPTSPTQTFHFRFFFSALKTEHNLGLLRCRYFITPNQSKK
jgi:hypothetical protein